MQRRDLLKLSPLALAYTAVGMWPSPNLRNRPRPKLSSTCAAKRHLQIRRFYVRWRFENDHLNCFNAFQVRNRGMSPKMDVFSASQRRAIGRFTVQNLSHKLS